MCNRKCKKYCRRMKLSVCTGGPGIWDNITFVSRDMACILYISHIYIYKFAIARICS